MLAITQAQLAGLQKAQADVLALRVERHLSKQGIAPRQTKLDNYRKYVLFAIDCGLVTELQVAQVAIFYASSGKSPTDADACLLKRRDVPWHSRLHELTGIAFAPEEVDG